MINVDFAHFIWKPDWDDLKRTCSATHKLPETGKKIKEEILNNARPSVVNKPFKFGDQQIECGAAVFPETCLTNPIANLAMWDEWDKGARGFPFDGNVVPYLPDFQTSKAKPSANVIGVFGEVFAGFFGQKAGIGKIGARLINRWPDFIFRDRNKGLTFVEAKAITAVENTTQQASKNLEDRFNWSGSDLWEALKSSRDALENTPNPYWLCLTQIVKYQPAEFQVTMLEIKNTNPASKHDLDERYLESLAATAVFAELADSRGDPNSIDLEAVKGRIKDALQGVEWNSQEKSRSQIKKVANKKLKELKKKDIKEIELIVQANVFSDEGKHLTGNPDIKVEVGPSSPVTRPSQLPDWDAVTVPAAKTTNGKDVWDCGGLHLWKG